MKRHILWAALVLGALATTGCQSEGRCADDSLGCAEPFANNGGNNGNNGGNNGFDPGDPVPNPADATARGVAGTWELAYTVRARNETMRLVSVATVTWTVEIFAVEKNEFSGTYDWDGAVTGGALCMLDKDEFDVGDGDCTDIGPLSLGRCSGHECRMYRELPINGHFDPETQTMRIGRHDGAAFFVDDERGYINVEAGLDNDAQPVDGSTEEQCDKWCTVNLRPRSILSDTFPLVESETRFTELTKLSTDRRRTDGVDDIERHIDVGDALAAADAIAGTWDITAQLHLDDDDVGSVRYELEIFEVVAIGEVGVYRWNGELTGVSMCLTPTGAQQCVAQTGARLGRCNSSSCTAVERTAASGDYDALRGTFQMSQTTADIYVERSDSSLSVEITFVVKAGTRLAEGRVAPTRCQTWCPWSLRTRGTFESDYMYTQGTANTFGMDRIP